AQKLGTAHYTDNVGNLDISLTDEASGQRATGSTFESEYFTYKVYGDDKEVALATRKNVDEDKKYELSVDYKTNKLYCRPITNKTCIDLHLEEGQDYGSSSQGVPCSGELNTTWGWDGVEEYIASSGGSCSVNDGVINYSFCDDGYCEEGTFGENFENFCWDDHGDTGCEESSWGDFGNKYCRYDGEGNRCQIQTENEDGIITNANCLNSNVYNGDCIAFDNMSQGRWVEGKMVGSFVQETRECLEINGLECMTWGEWIRRK
ncbi:MAG: hypothetical protein II972_03165, partial [Elusimicrobiaceae bacterium]|nr:hypothetical protein [Elusimicrobiaceae bacterium]